MPSKAMLIALVVATAGCGASGAETRTTAAQATTDETATDSATTDEATTDEATTAAPAAPPSRRTVTGHHAVNCDGDFPRVDVPDEPVLFTSGALRVRAQSLVLDTSSEDSTVTYCTAREPLPEGTRLVMFIDDYSGGATTWDGTRIGDPYARDDFPTEEGEDGQNRLEWRTVTLAGQSVSAVRQMAYCPTDPARSCLAAGDYTQLLALPYGDPNGPRSGWDFTETALRPVRARPAPTVTGVNACGLTVGYRRFAGCNPDTFEALQACSTAMREAWMVEDEEGAEARARASQLVVSDGTSELVMPGANTWQIACVDHVAIIYDNPIDVMSRRSFVAIELAEGRIARARRMTIVDHEEGRSDCANAWDGVSLAPILRHGALLGAVVHGAGASPRFDVTRGDVGDATFAPTGEDADEDEDTYGNAPTPRAFQVTGRGLAPLEVSTTQAAPPCPLRVVDPDGQTNVRPDPSTRRPPVGTIPTGTVIQPVEQRGRWYRIEAPHAGWLFAGSLARRCGP